MSNTENTAVEESPVTQPAEKTLVSKMTGISLVLAIVVFLLNMVAAWWVTGESTEVIGRPLVEEASTATSLVLQGTPGAKANTQLLLNRVLDTELMLRTAQNRHTITVVSLSVAFALVAIGFALFVMGAEGAFRLEGKVRTESNLMVKATAPGLICFVLAAVVVIFALKARTELEPGAFTLYPDSNLSEFVEAGGVAGSNGASVAALVVQAPPELAPDEAQVQEDAETPE